LWEDIRKIVAVGFLDDETPEAVTDVELRKKEFVIPPECPAYNAVVEGVLSQSPLQGCQVLRV
jgi:hypothetical protein